MRYIPKFFTLEEVLPGPFYMEHIHAYKDRLWDVFDYRVLITGDWLRKRWGPMQMNTWHLDQGVAHSYRGFRPFDCPIGARLSQHKFGRAWDLMPLGADVEDIREDIKRYPMSSDYRYITCIEVGVPWLHFDVRNWNKHDHGIKIIKPK